MTEPSSRPPEPLDYATFQPSIKGAVTSMVFGLCALPLVLLDGLGVIPGFIGLTGGLLALSRIRKDPLRYAGVGFAYAGILTGVLAILGGALTFAMPHGCGSREMANRSVCAANLRQLTQACIVYSASEADAFPTAGAPAAAGEYTVAFGVVSDPQPNGLAAMREVHAKAAGSPVASVWMLVLQESLSPKSLLCRSDPLGMVSPSPILAPRASATGPNSYYLSPEKPGQISYSIAYPWNGAGKSATLNYWWMNRSDSEAPVAADMAPLEGSSSLAVTPAPTSVPKSEKAWNSFNHGGRGQNVVFNDGHAEWINSPVSAYAKDNIWSIGEVGKTSDGTGGMAGAAGRVPVPTKGWATASPFDVIMVPVRDGSTGAVR